MGRKHKRYDIGGISCDYGVTFIGSKYVVGAFDDPDGYKSYVIAKTKEECFEMNIHDLFNTNGKRKFNLFNAISNLIVAFVVTIASLYIQMGMKVTGLFNIIYILILCWNIIYLFTSLKEYYKIHYSIKRYHGAEHKTLNAFERYGRIPTIDEISKESRYHSRCGISMYSNYLFFFLINFIIAFKFDLFFLPISILRWISECLPTVNPFSPLIQLFVTTSKPTKVEMRCAQLALKELVNLEDDKKDIRDDIKPFQSRIDRLKYEREDLMSERNLSNEEVHYYDGYIHEYERLTKYETELFKNVTPISLI